MIKLGKDNKGFERNGAPFFWLADTVWSAFTNASLDEWRLYLDVRKKQGFNTLQINILPQWDRSVRDEIIHPFAIDENTSTYVISKHNPIYFEHARKMVQMAKEQDFEVALVLLWCSYIPDTWADKIKRTVLINLDDVNEYTELVSSYFSEFDPVYIISGDTDFEQEKTSDYYETSLNKIKQLAPNCLTTLHIRGRLSDLPQKLQENPGLDFYVYQSGHNSLFPDCAWQLAEVFSAKQPTKPVINMEPCYEMMGYSRNIYGRFGRFDVRKAAWQSVLSGARAGITYGAHGVWSWHHADSAFGETVGEGFLTPFTWHDALHFEGAWDYAFIKELFDQYNLYDIEPWPLADGMPDQIRCARNDDLTVIYSPYARDLVLREEREVADVIIIGLEERKTGRIDHIRDGNVCRIPMPAFPGDCLYIVKFK